MVGAPTRSPSHATIWQMSQRYRSGKGHAEKLPNSLVMVGGHSASFTARELLEHSDGALNCVLRGEGEPGMPEVLEAFQNDRTALARVPGVVTLEGEGPRPGFVKSLTTWCP